jgi:uncharacterized protein YjbJ (UPF0337 family)
MKKKHYTAEQRRKLAPVWGKLGGNELLIAEGKGKRITINGKLYEPKKKRRK